MTSVAIIDAGSWGSMSRRDGDYEQQVSAYERALTLRGAKVVVVKSVEKARSWLSSRDGGVALFTTRGMIKEAQELVAADPKIRVVLLTGLLPDPVPDDGVIYYWKMADDLIDAIISPA